MKEKAPLPEVFSQILAGFRYSRILLSAIELDVFSAVGTGATADKVANRIGSPERSVTILLRALTSMSLLKKERNKYFNSELAKEYLSSSGKHDWRLALHHHISLWNTWTNLTECIKRGSGMTSKERRQRDTKWQEAFIESMHKNSMLRAPLVARALKLSGSKKILDLGGGSGGFSIAFAQTNRNLQITLFDLPESIACAKKYIKKANLTRQIKTKTGDIFLDDFGSGYDFVLVSSVSHIFSPEKNKKMLEKIHSSLAANGQVVIHDFILNEEETGPEFSTLFAVNMLVATEEGNTYKFSDYQKWLRSTGFGPIKKITLKGPSDLVVAKKSV